jgi:hypothetical protein
MEINTKNNIEQKITFIRSDNVKKISFLVEPKANGLKVQCSTTELCTLKEGNF